MASRVYATSDRWSHGSTRPQFDGFTGLTDLSSIDDLDLIRFLSQFSTFHTAGSLDRDTVAVGHVTFGVSGAVFRGMRHIVAGWAL